MRPDDVPLAILSWLGRQGTRAVAAIVVVGIALPSIGASLKPYVTEAVFLLLCIAFLRADVTTLRSSTFLRFLKSNTRLVPAILQATLKPFVEAADVVDHLSPRHDRRAAQHRHGAFAIVIPVPA